VDCYYRKEDNENAQTSSTSAPISPTLSVPQSSLARGPLTASTFPDDNQDPPLLCWADDGLSSPIQPLSLNGYSTGHASEVLPSTSASNPNYRSPSENDSVRRDAPRPPAGIDQNNPLSLGGPVTHLHKKRFSVVPICEIANSTDYPRADGLLYNEGPAEVDLKGSLEIEIDSLLDELVDYHSKRRTAVTSAPLLPLPEESSPSDGPIHSQPGADLSSLPLLTANMLYNGDSDTPSLTSSSPMSPNGSQFSPASPSLKSKRCFTPGTPSTDGWKSPPILAPVPEHKASSSDYLGYTKVPGCSVDWSPDPYQAREDVTKDTYPSVSRVHRGAYHGNLPPLRTMIPEDSIIQRRTKKSVSSERTVTYDRSHRVETPINHSVSSSSHFSDDDASEVTGIGYIDPSFDPAYPSSSSAVSPHLTRPSPRVDIPREPGSGSFTSRRSPSSSTGPSSVNSPPPSGMLYVPGPGRGMFRSLFPPNGTPEKKKERKQVKARDPIQTQSLAARSADAISFSSTSSKRSRDKERKRAEKAEKAGKRVQLAVQRKAKQPQKTVDKDRGGTLRATGAQKGAAPWEENGSMYSMDGIY